MILIDHDHTNADYGAENRYLEQVFATMCDLIGINPTAINTIVELG